MHKTLQRQLRKLGLAEDKPPDNREDWQLFLKRIDCSYAQSDDGMYTLKRSSDIAADEMEELNKELAVLASFPGENVGPVMRFSKQGKIEYSNIHGNTVLKHWGFKVGDILDAHYLIAINNVFSTNKELVFEQSIGEIIYTLRFVPIVNSGYVNVYGTDISQQKKIESNLIEAIDEAEVANIEKSRFLANMSHELRTPMHAILGFVSLSLKQEISDKVARYLKNIEVSGLRLTELLNNILDLAKLESGKVEVQFDRENLTEIVNSCVDELETLCLDKKVTVVISTQQPFEGDFDKRLITQVIINLLSNAIRFSPAGGQIDVKLTQHAFFLHNKSEMVLEAVINDQGIGVPEDERESIFNKFIQSSKTVSQAGGTGLGLSICEEIIQAHDGLIWVENRSVNKATLEVRSVESNLAVSNFVTPVGASFHFILPVTQSTHHA